MKRILTATLVLFLAFSCKHKTEIKDTYNDVRSKFENPPMEYRSMPLWVWNLSLIHI